MEQSVTTPFEAICLSPSDGTCVASSRQFGYEDANDAARLSDELGGAQIWLKREDLCHTGAHKINNTIGQILIANRMGKKRIIAETGAGQHGVATATVCALFGLSCTIYMGAVDIERQQPNVFRMKLLGAEVVPVTSGSKTLKDAIDRKSTRLNSSHT